jgi:hypothetical protein
MRCVPPPWTIEEHNSACFIVKDATGQALVSKLLRFAPWRLKNSFSAMSPLLVRDEYLKVVAVDIACDAVQISEAVRRLLGLRLTPLGYLVDGIGSVPG